MPIDAESKPSFGAGKKRCELLYTDPNLICIRKHLLESVMLAKVRPERTEVIVRSSFDRQIEDSAQDESRDPMSVEILNDLLYLRQGGVVARKDEVHRADDDIPGEITRCVVSKARLTRGETLHQYRDRVAPLGVINRNSSDARFDDSFALQLADNRAGDE